MGWQIILVDWNRRLRNGGITMLREGVAAEKEAWSRASTHNSLVAKRGDKIMNVVCVKRS
jgi:hypothetical protein